MSQTVSQSVSLPMSPSSAYLYDRHRWPVRVMHWVNVVCLTILLMSGLNIFAAHPGLYWGKSSYTGRPAILEIGAKEGEGDSLVGTTRIFGHEFNTTGFLGAGRGPDGTTMARTFPSWMTIPDTRWLSMARNWHFFFAWLFVINGICYVSYSIVSRHLSRDLSPTRDDWRSIGRSIRDHIRFRHPSGEDSKRYNVLQKLAYLIVIFVMLPAIILMGFGMSPGLDSLFSGWVGIVGGRQSARTIHFLIAWLLVAFVVIHVFEVIITGLWNNVRSMVTGRYRVEPGTRHEAD